MDTTYYRLQSELDQDPDSPARKLLGDYFEDQGDLACAEAWHWISNNNRRPGLYAGGNWRWAWWLVSTDTTVRWGQYCTDNLPPVLWKCLMGIRDGRGYCKLYTTRREAEEDLVRVIIGVTQYGTIPEVW